MKLLAVGKTKLKIERKDGEIKTFKATGAVLKYAKANLKKGDIIKAKFDDGKIVEVKKVALKKKDKGRFKSNGGEGKISLYKSIATMIPGVKGVDVKNVRQVIRELFEDALKLVREEKIEKEEEEDEFSGEELVGWGACEFDGSEEEGEEVEEEKEDDFWSDEE